MTVELGLSAEQKADLYALLFGPHRVKIDLTLMDLNHKVIGALSNTLLSGEVVVDSTSDIQRQMNLELFDPTKSLQLDPNDPRDGTAYPSRMIQCYYCVGAMDGSRWYRIPVFTGPINKLDRNGPVLRVECLGKEILTSSGLWIGVNGYKNWNKVNLFRTLMAEKYGETMFAMQADPGVTTVDQAIEQGGALWSYGRLLMNGIGMQTFYNGLGVLVVRKRPTVSSVTFDQKRTLDDINPTYDLGDFWNCVQVVGAKPKKAKTPLHAFRHLPADHPLSYISLSRNNIGYYRPKLEENSELNTQQAVDKRADELLAEGALQAVDVTAPVVPFPLLEEDDIATFVSDSFRSDQRVKKFNIPLVITNPQMAVGYTLNTKPSALVNALRRP